MKICKDLVHIAARDEKFHLARLSDAAGTLFCDYANAHPTESPVGNIIFPSEVNCEISPLLHCLDCLNKLLLNDHSIEVQQILPTRESLLEIAVWCSGIIEGDTIRYKNKDIFRMGDYIIKDRVGFFSTTKEIFYDSPFLDSL